MDVMESLEIWWELNTPRSSCACVRFIGWQRREIFFVLITRQTPQTVREASLQFVETLQMISTLKSQICEFLVLILL